jgi:hypothetical protein
MITKAEEMRAWRYNINYGPDGEEDWANLVTPEGQHVANIRTRHAIAIVEGLNTLEKLLSAEDAWADYGSGFRLHFNFHVGGDMSVVERVNSLRALRSIPRNTVSVRDE